MKTVLFDLDGTLADTEALKAQSLAHATKKFGGVVEPEIYKSVMGQSWEVVTSHFLKTGGTQAELSAFNKEFRENYQAIIDTQLEDSRQAVQFIQQLKSKKLLLGLVTSASPWMVQKVLEKLSLANVFDVVVTGADSDKHKPHPDAYLIALKKLNVSVDEAIAFEDSESGIQAAKAAGLVVYGIRHEFNQNHDFSKAERILQNFQEGIEMLPLGN